MKRGDGSTPAENATTAAAVRHYAGILVTAAPGRFDAVAAALAALDGLEVHQRDEAGGRLVVVQETADREGQEEGLRRILAVPGVAAADLHYHVVDREDDL